MKGNELVTALIKKFRLNTERELADLLHVSAVTVAGLRKTEIISVNKFANLIAKTLKSGAAKAEAEAVMPVVEFFVIDRSESKQSTKYELFSIEVEGKVHKYREGLKKELCGHHGVYIFFDSAGKAIYVGKAKRQNLWSEMTNAYNRARAQQIIKLVSHPSRNQDYTPCNEKERQITPRYVKLCEMATYFSAYSVANGMIDSIESLLIRSFANNLLNTKMEKAVAKIGKREKR